MDYNMLSCPYCKSGLKLGKKSLTCKCGKKFPIEKGIPVFTEKNIRELFYEDRYGSRYEKTVLEDNDKIKLSNSIDFVLKGGKKFQNVLDIGCNPAMTKFLADKTGSKTIGLSITPKGMYEDGNWVICDVEKGLPFSDNLFDLIFCGELIEHTFNTDYFISEANRVMKDGGYLIITTPNLASFWNRIFLMLGYQPHQLGISTKNSYGNPFLKWDRFWGHTKLFTYKSLKEFIMDNNFDIVKIYGEFIRNENDSKLKRFIRAFMSSFPSLSEDLICICKKSTNS